MEELFIKVGIKTRGKPIIRKGGDFTLLENMLIGDGFHWETTIQAKLPGKVSSYNIPSEISEADHNISLINILPLEIYLECVVGSEMNPSAPIEFLKAHAVISRSWALGKILDIHNKDNCGKINTETCIIGWEDTSGHQGFHVCSDDHCQRYQGIQSISAAAKKAIQETSGEILIDRDGNPVDTRFSKCCGGRTELFETCWQPVHPPGLESFIDPWCDLSFLSSSGRRTLLSSILKDYDLTTKGYGYSWEIEISREEIKKNLRECFERDLGDILQLEALHRGPSGRIDLLRIRGTHGYLDLGKELWIRRLLSPTHLYSSNFEIIEKKTSFHLRGKGWGHGVGLCQIGASNMAHHHYSYRDILSFYYPDCKIQRC